MTIRVSVTKVSNQDLLDRAQQYLEDTRGHPLRKSEADTQELLAGLMLIAAHVIGQGIGRHVYEEELKGEDGVDPQAVVQPFLDGHIENLRRCMVLGISMGRDAHASLVSEQLKVDLTVFR